MCNLDPERTVENKRKTGKPLRFPGWDCRKNRKSSAVGKEDRYERNPSGVSFVCNHRFFRTFEVLKNRTQPVEKAQQKAVQLRDFVIPEKFGIVVLCGYAVFLPI